jgi:chemotaxis protein MotB
MASRVRRTPRTNEIWPGFVDALSTLLMVIIFLLVAFMLAQYFLTVAISGRDEALDRLSRQLNELSELLSLERKANAELRLDIAQLSSELQSSTASRDELSARLSLVLAEQDELRTQLSSALDERDDLNVRVASALAEREALDARLTGVLSERDALDTRLTSVLSERDALDLRLTEVSDRAKAAEAQAEALRAALAEAKTTVTADRETIELKLAEIASLQQDLAALRKVRAKLESDVARLAAALDQNREVLAQLKDESAKLSERNKVLVVQLGKSEEALAGSREVVARLSEERTALRDRSKSLEARLSDEAERTTLAQSEIAERDIRLNELQLALRQRDDKLLGQQNLSARAQAQVELLNRQIIALRKQLARIAKALEAAEVEAEEQKVVIANLGQKLNLALAGKVEELQRYRSEFFGRLREVLGDRPGVQIVGDRFVFQSEVLFASGSAVLGEDGARQMAKLAATLLDIARQIPDDLHWILRVDGHTDVLPINTAQFPSNWELSTARAISVVRFLNSQGVPAEHLAATGFGEFQPIDPRGTEEAYRRNRRIELKLTNR